MDGGFGGFLGTQGMTQDYVVQAEAQRRSMHLPAVLGLRFAAADPSLRAVWGGAGGLLAITDVAQERKMTEGVRGLLRSVGTAAKLALPVRDGLLPVGLLCADWHHEAPRWDAEVCNQLGGFLQDALGPLLAAATRLESGRRSESAAAREALATLTPAELKVARLVARGLSYKEVARELDRALSTVDHQLRSIREKLGVRSTARLVHLLGEQFERPPH